MKIPPMLRPFLAAFLITSVAAQEPLPQVPPTPAEKAAGEFRTLSGFRMTLLAAEPQVTDPVAMCYDADGRAYVAEMNDYPYTDKANHKPSQENPTDEAIGKVRLLEDTDGDGVFDKATVFADGLSWPTGVAPWKGGVFVTAAPDLWYFKDTDGDGVADVKDRVLTGYRKYNVQAEVNNPAWGLDHRLYIASASNGGRLYAPSRGPDSAVDLGRNDIRLDPGNPERFEKIAGGIQFGNSFDDWGNRFLSNNSRPVYHVVLPLDALDRNPWLPSRQTTQLCTDPDEPIQLFPITAIEEWRLQRYKDRTHVPRKGYRPPRGTNPGDPSSPTSSAAPVVYRGDAYPDGHRGTVFVAESCYNLLYHLDLEREGATFRATKPESDGKADFVASEDVWFRPTNFVNAPDGCLHVTDFYREAIEHPWSLPEEFHARMDLERGRDKGRLYRLEPPGYKHRPAPKLGEASAEELVALLEHPNAWHRETAHRLLFERQDGSVEPAVRALSEGSAEPLGRLHALWTLHGLGRLDPSDVTRAAKDDSPGVRANAARLAGMILGDHPGLATTICEMRGDPDPAVRFEVALALGAVPPDPGERANAAEALAALARSDAGDSWTRLAILSSSVPHASSMLDSLAADPAFFSSESSAPLLASLARIVGARNREGEPAALLDLLSRRGRPDATTLAIVAGLDTGLRSAKSSLAAAAGESGAPFLSGVLEEATERARDSATAAALRTEAIRLLRFADYDEISSLLAHLLSPTEPSEVRSAAAATLSAVAGTRPDVAPLLLEGWSGYNTELRGQVIQLLLARPERLGALLDAIAAGRVQPYQVGPTRRELLLSHEDPAIQARARELFSGAASREEVLEKYRGVAGMDGDPEKGEVLYQSVCMACHKFREKGLIDLAPNLAVVESWETERILTNILDPNREVAPEYVESIVETKSGEVLTGRVVAESATGITLKQVDNSTRDISRDEIARFENTGRSIMPDGLEAALPPQAMADLIAYLRGR